MNNNSLAYRKKIWQKEYQQRKNLPSSRTDFPSRALKNFLEEFKPTNKSSALDLGSGNGRNSIFLAQVGYSKVIGVEFVESAVTTSREKAKDNGLDTVCKFINQSVGEKLDLEDNSFDLIIDMMVMHSLDKDERDVEISEITRLLKPGGYFVFYTIASESEAAIDLINKNPGNEIGSYKFKVDEDWITEKTFSIEEIRKMFSKLNLVKIEPKEEFTPAFGDVFKRKYYYGVMQKP